MNRYTQDGVMTLNDGPLDDDDIVTFLMSKIDNALNKGGSTEENTRTEMYDRYVGAPIGDESDGQSTFRTREVLEMVEDALPSLLSVFLSADTPVLFEPVKQDDVEAAKQETDVVNYHMFNRAEAYLPLQNLLKSTLLDPVAYCKVHCVHQEETIHHHYESLTPPQFLSLIEGREWDKGVEIEELRGAPPFGVGYRFKGTEIRTKPRFLVESIPGHEVLVDEGARFLDLDEVWRDYGFICHATQLTYTELVQRGYDRDRLDDLPSYSDVGSVSTSSRDSYNRGFRRSNNYNVPRPSVTDQSTRRFDVFECYVKLDVEGTGLAESWRIVLVGGDGGEVFEKEKVSYQPFVAVSAIPMPHAHVGLSMAESMADLQALKTKLVRSLLNDIYRNEARRSYVNKGSLLPDTDDQLSDPMSAYVIVKGDPRQAIMPEPQFSVADEVLGILRYADDMLKRRTGMAPDNALNPDVLRDATAHGMLASMDRQSNRLMGVARTIAETGIKKIGVKLHQLLRMYQDRETTLLLRGKWVDVRPADWIERTDMKVAVGLGFNSKEQTVAALTQLLGMQKEALGQGLAKPEHIKNTLEKLIEATNLGFYGQFFADPTAPGWKPPPPPPNPQMEAVKAQAQAVQMQEKTKAMEIQAKNQEAMAKLEIEKMKAKIDQGRILADAHLKQVRAQMESTLLAEAKLAEVQKTQAETQKIKAEIVKISVDVDKTDAETEALSRQDSPQGEEPGGNQDGEATE